MIRKIFLLSFIILAAIFVTAGTPDGYDIKIHLKGLKKDTIAILYQNFGKKQKIIDTIQVGADGMLEFKGKDNLAEGMYLIFVPDDVYFQILVDNQRFTIETKVDDLVGSAKVKGSEENRIFYEFQQAGKKHVDESKRITDLMIKYDDKSDSTAILKEQLKKLNEDRENFNQSFVEKYPASFFVKILTSTKPVDIPDAPKGDDGKPLDEHFALHYLQKHYFDFIDFSDDRFIRTPILEEKAMDYLDRLTVPHPDSINASIDFILSKAKANDEVYKFLLSSIFNKYNTTKLLGADGIFVHLVENYYAGGKAEWADSAFLEEVTKRAMELRTSLIGKKAVNVTLLDTMDQKIPLYSVNAKFLILFFYEPDCGHCKKETPKMLDLYHKYQQYGVEVYGACTKTDVEEWKKFINDYGLDWINVADPYTQSNFRYYYDVRSTPRIYLLDKDKKILINKNIGVDQLEKVLRDKLNLPPLEEKPGENQEEHPEKELTH